VFGASDLCPWMAGAPSALILAHAHLLAVDDQILGSLKQPTRIFSRRATESLNKLPCSPNRQGFSSKKRLSLRVGKDTLPVFVTKTPCEVTKTFVTQTPCSRGTGPECLSSHVPGPSTLPTHSTHTHTHNTKGALCAEATPPDQTMRVSVNCRASSVGARKQAFNPGRCLWLLRRLSLTPDFLPSPIPCPSSSTLLPRTAVGGWTLGGGCPAKGRE
jgi:hypothetical protein